MKGTQESTARNQRRGPNHEARIHMQVVAYPSRSLRYQQHHLKGNIPYLALAAAAEPLLLREYFRLDLLLSGTTCKLGFGSHGAEQ